MKAITSLETLGLRPTVDAPPPSNSRFPDGGAFRIEIPSVEGPRALEAVLGAAEEHGVTLNRISQGSGAMLLTLADLREMVALAAGHGAELALFVGPRAEWDIGAFSRSPIGASQSGGLRGVRGLSYAVEDVYRAVEVGVRSFLVADIGLLSVLTELRTRGDLPADCVWKVSAYLAPCNPATLRVLEQLGAGTINVVSDLTVSDLADLRAHVSLPIDLYLEAPDSMGGIVRSNEIGDFIEVGAPLYVKFGLRNAPPAYPSGEHVTADAILTGRERVRRAAIAMEWLSRTHPDIKQSPRATAGATATTSAPTGP
jgi:hypothetical protein